MSFLKGLFGGRKADESRQPRSTARKRGENLLNELAPLQTSDSQEASGASQETSAGQSAGAAHLTSDQAQSFICREPILNRSGHMAAYEFLLRKYPKHRIHHETRAVLRLYDEVLIRNLIDMHIDRLLGNRLAIVGIFPASLNSRLFELLPHQGIVLMIRNASEFLEIISGDPLSSLRALKKEGFRIGLEDFAESHEMAPFLQLADFAVIDVADTDSGQLSRRVELLVREFPEIQLLARNIESMEAFDACRSLGFHYFQGPFLTRLEQLEQPKVNADQIRLYELLNLLQKDAEVKDLADVFKLDPTLTYKLLRYINSPGGGLVSKVSTIDHAITVLGQKKLYRWLTLLLFNSGNVNPQDWALMENALVRGRLVEMFGRDQFPPNLGDELFIAGFFSLLDVLLRMPIGEALAQLKLPEVLVQALVYRQGKYAPYLELAIACEQFDQERIAELAKVCGLDVQKVNILHVEAMIWAADVEK